MRIVASGAASGVTVAQPAGKMVQAYSPVAFHLEVRP
jgi:hypothetical protein